jgi:flagellar hook assembly protein FlgD
VLVDERKKAGTHTVVWQGGNSSGQSVSSGVYLGRLSFDGKTRTQKLVVVK